MLDRECFSMERSNITISPVNELANIETRDMVYRDFLNMLNLEGIIKVTYKESAF